jgi:hypothetical protein
MSSISATHCENNDCFLRNGQREVLTHCDYCQNFLCFECCEDAETVIVFDSIRTVRFACEAKESLISYGITVCQNCFLQNESKERIEHLEEDIARDKTKLATLNHEIEQLEKDRSEIASLIYESQNERDELTRLLHSDGICVGK